MGLSSARVHARLVGGAPRGKRVRGAKRTFVSRTSYGVQCAIVTVKCFDIGANMRITSNTTGQLVRVAVSLISDPSFNLNVSVSLPLSLCLCVSVPIFPRTNATYNLNLYEL